MVAGGKALSLIFEGSEIQVKARSCTDPEKAQVQLTEPAQTTQQCTRQGEQREEERGQVSTASHISSNSNWAPILSLLNSEHFLNNTHFKQNTMLIKVTIFFVTSLLWVMENQEVISNRDGMFILAAELFP